MSITQSDTLPDPVDVARSILAESMVPLDEPAFEKARDEFGRTYAQAFTAHPVFDRDGQAHDEALADALQAFLGTYLTEAAKR